MFIITGNKIKEQLLNYKDRETMRKNLRIKRFNTGTKSASDIENYIKKLRNRGFSPDLVIIDYFECLAHEPDRSATNEYEREGKTMRKFEAMAGELDMAFWIPSQGISAVYLQCPVRQSHRRCSHLQQWC